MTAMPQRIQLRRITGWRKPQGAIVVARPTNWGNPFRVGASRGDRLPPLTAEQAVRLFEQWLTARVAHPIHGVDRALILNNLHQLRGHDLACWCPLELLCHADVLLSLANPQPEEVR